MRTLKEVLILRDDNTPEEADELISIAKERMMNGDDQEEILHEEFGLEPDYVFDLIEM